MHLILLILAGMGLWHGGDGLWVNMTSGKLTTFSVETVEDHGIGNNRFINITGGTWGGGVAYQYDQDNHQVDFVIYPLVSADTYTEIAEGNDSSIQILVKKTAHTSEANLDSWLEEQGMNLDEVTVQGVTLVGFNAIGDEFKDLIESMDMTVSDSVIFLEEDSEPRALLNNLAMFIPAFLYFSFMVVGFFSKNDKDVVVETEASDEEHADAEAKAYDIIKMVMVFVMLADDEIEDEEVEAIQSIYKQLTDQEYTVEQLTEDIKYVQAGTHTVGSLLANAEAVLSDSGKRLTFEAALMIAASDGEIHPDERQVLNNIEIFLGLATDEVTELYQKHGAQY